MKLKKNLVLREVADTWVIIPVADDVLDFNGLVSLNDTGVFLWNLIENGKTKAEMISALLCEYDVSQSAALSDVEKFLETLYKIGCLED